MSTGRKSPQSLRDRLFSNSPDPLKSSILRESGMGWASTPPESQDSPNNGSITPLRITKRESPHSSGPQVVRRTSSSYSHVRNNNLVTKSPFKLQTPTPPTPSRPSSVAFPLARRVSGEKRPRPVSIHEQTETENERPFALKRERRQSKGFQNLLEKEPVSKSPFRLQRSNTQTPSPVPSTSESRIPVPSTSQLPEPGFTLRDQTPSPGTGPSPARSSLVSRRLHGPRLSGIGRRERRKTVSFDERCEVVEFALDDDEEDDFISGEDEMSGDGSDRQDDDDNPFFRGGDPSHCADVPDEDVSFDSTRLSDMEAETPVSTLLHLDPDTSITGLVDEMFASNSATGEVLRRSTPPRTADIPLDLETENGVPLGRSHHVEHSLQHHQHPYHLPHPVPPFFSQNQSLDQSQSRRSPSVSNSPGDFPFNIAISPRASPLGRPIIPRRSPIGSTSTPPHGRPTHAEHVQIAREDVQIAREDETSYDVDADIDPARLPVSPSPMKPLMFGRRDSDIDALIPPYGTRNIQDATTTSLLEFDSSAHGNIDDSTNEDDFKDDSLNLSIGNSEISLTSLGRDPETLISNVEKDKTCSEGNSIFGEEQFKSLSPRPAAVEGCRSSPLLIERSHSPASLPSHMSSPLFRSGSPLLMNRDRNGSNASLTGRQRITREDVQRRLLTRRSLGSPAPEVEPESKCSSAAGELSTSQSTENMMMLGDQDDTKSSEQALGTVANAREGNELVSTEVVDVEMSDERDTRYCATSLSGSIGNGVSSQDAIRTSPTIKSAVLGEVAETGFGGPDSLGVLPRTSGDDVKMDSVSSGSSGNSSATVVDAVNRPSIKLEFNDVNMDMKSALDRLMDDVAGVGSREGEDSIMTERESFEASASSVTKPNRGPLARAMTEPTPLLHTSTGIGFSPDKDKSDSSIEATPPPLPPKDNRSHEQMESDSGEESEKPENFHPRRQIKSKRTQQRLLGVGRPSRRRSMSTGDADLLHKRSGGGLLDGVVAEVEGNDALADSIEEELKKLVEPPKKTGYHVREREATIYASSSDPDGVAHMSGPGDVNTGKAWRAVRKPSDMNEYSKQIKECRAQEKPGKAYGKIFVKILGIRNLLLPLPHQPTSIACTLNNGIHFVTTPECQLSQNTRIEQEFELIEHSKLEFTLTLKVKRDPHIMAQFKSLTPAPAPPPAPIPVVQAPSKGGMRSFFSSTQKKPSRDRTPIPSPPAPVRRLPENIARYMKPDGTLARSFVAFKDIAPRCDARLFETSYPLIGQRLEVGGKFSTQQVGELVLQIFRLPPLPGLTPDQLPQSLDECCRGLRHINWHKVTYFEGTLTQNGGDCSMWRRRRFRVVGANLVAFNDVTKKATATINLKQAIAIEDDQQGRGTSMSPASSRTGRYGDEYDAVFGVERSFRLMFSNDEEIVFFADTDEEKAKWLEIFRALVGHIPPHPLWGELLWQRQEELTKLAQSQSSP